MTSVYFTSDLHFGHALVANLRGFDSTEEHDAEVSRRWRETVTDRDAVWVLGDLALSHPDHVLKQIVGLPGIKHFVSGNHDPVHPMHRNAAKWQRRFLEVFESVQPFVRRKLDGRTVLLSHFPYDSDHTDVPRYMQYRLPDLGEWLLHGHTHGPERRHGHEIHVGLDAWDLAPVSIDQIVALMREVDA